MKSLDEYGDTIVELSDFVKRLDDSIRLEAFRFLLAREVGSVESSGHTSAPARKSDRSRGTAPQELIRTSGVTTFTEKAVVLAYWLEEFQQRQTFSSSDLKAAFEQAREPSPKNTSDLVAKLEGTARLMRADKVAGIQQYRLTGTAIQEVERWINPEGNQHESQ